MFGASSQPFRWCGIHACLLLSWCRHPHGIPTRVHTCSHTMCGRPLLDLRRPVCLPAVSKAVQGLPELCRTAQLNTSVKPKHLPWLDSANSCPCIPTCTAGDNPSWRLHPLLDVPAVCLAARWRDWAAPTLCIQRTWRTSRELSWDCWGVALPGVQRRGCQQRCESVAANPYLPIVLPFITQRRGARLLRLCV